MAECINKFKATDLSKELTVNIIITGIKIFRLRVFFAKLFFKIGAWIGGVGVVIQKKGVK